MNRSNWNMAILSGIVVTKRLVKALERLEFHQSLLFFKIQTTKLKIIGIIDQWEKVILVVTQNTVIKKNLIRMKVIFHCYLKAYPTLSLQLLQPMLLHRYLLCTQSFNIYFLTRLYTADLKTSISSVIALGKVDKWDAIDLFNH